MKTKLIILSFFLFGLTACGKTSDEPSTSLEPTNTILPAASITPEPTATETLLPTPTLTSSPTPIPLPDPITQENISNLVLVNSLEGRYMGYISSLHLLIIQGESSFYGWNPALNSEIYSINGTFLEFSPDKLMLLVKNEGGIEVRASDTGDLLMSFPDFSGAIFDPIDGKVLVKNSESGIAQLWEIGGTAPVHEFQQDIAYYGQVWGFDFSMDGSFVIGVEAFRLFIWDANTGDLLHEYTHDGHGGTIKIDPTRNMIAHDTGGLGWEIIDLRSGEVLQRYQKRFGLNFSGDGKYVILVDMDARLNRFVVIETFETVTSISGLYFGFLDLEKNIFSISENDSFNFHFWIYDYESFEQIAYFYSDTGLVGFISNQSEILGLIDCKYHCWRPWMGTETTFYNIYSGDVIFELPREEKFYYSGVFTPDDRWLFLLFRDEEGNYATDIWEIP